MWDSRLARWTSTDPYGQFHSPYLGMGNNPVSGFDPDGGAWNWVGAAIGAGIGAGYAVAGDWKGAVVGGLAGGLGGGLLGDGIGNVLKGNPWGCLQCPNLGKKVGGPTSGYIAQGRFISDDYLAALGGKSASWAVNLYAQYFPANPDVPSKLDWNYAGNYRNSHVVQDLGKVTSLSFNLLDGTGPMQDLIAGHNNNVFIAGNNIPAGVRNLFKPSSGDVIRVQGIDRTVNEALFEGDGSISENFMLRAFEKIHKIKGTMTLGSFGLDQVSIKAKPTPKYYRIRVSYK